MAKSALLVFVKEPLAGKVKTRLSPELSEEEAAALYQAFIQDSYREYKDLENSVDLHYYFYPSNDLLKDLIPEQKNWHLQKGNELGEKMANAIDEQLKNYRSCLLIGSDHPSLPIAYLKKAFSVLDYVDISIGASDDGGYYCIGMKKRHPKIFSNIEWSTSSVFEKTIEKITHEKLDFFQVPNAYDIDTIENLKRFIREEDLNRFPKIAAVISSLSYTF